ncbi:uncharacterized protein LOC111251619 [Varroa destructor]|uniref:Uncharacterized protein n=1 Tax=Varroa destructor TaxID=109461 RepID=A0A7M7KII1_VARDE|nr:uncharacterized protein LOC111251619 [Varroa destructor]
MSPNRIRCNVKKAKLPDSSKQSVPLVVSTANERMRATTGSPPECISTYPEHAEYTVVFLLPNSAIQLHQKISYVTLGRRWHTFGLSFKIAQYINMAQIKRSEANELHTF